LAVTANTAGEVRTSLRDIPPSVETVVATSTVVVLVLSSYYLRVAVVDEVKPGPQKHGKSTEIKSEVVPNPLSVSR
jgi:hypothetical protein